MNNESPLTQDEKTYGMLVHLAALAQLVMPTFGNIIGPLVVWLIKKDQSAWVDKQGKEALNFQISAAIYAIVSIILIPVIIGIILLIAVGIFWLVMVIIAAVRVNEGEDFKYPLCIRFIK
ncbi:MAG TPA: DUF4870 domain-containing protein [Firmicutes bacterium]|nr:DUF4870 domain-containing protein [Bacillota bacterium]